jgi:hypothetical protein
MARRCRLDPEQRMSSAVCGKPRDTVRCRPYAALFALPVACLHPTPNQRRMQANEKTSHLLASRIERTLKGFKRHPTTASQRRSGANYYRVPCGTSARLRHTDGMTFASLLVMIFGESRHASRSHSSIQQPGRCPASAGRVAPLWLSSFWNYPRQPTPGWWRRPHTGR